MNNIIRIKIAKMCKAKTIKVTRAIANKDEKRRKEENVHDRRNFFSLTVNKAILVDYVHF